MEMDSISLDVFKEIGNIGAGNAATALSGMLNRAVQINLPTVSLLEYDALAKLLGGPENLVVGILIEVNGDIKGTMMFLLDQEFVHEIIDTLVGHQADDLSSFSEFELSVLQEVGNIIAASYINSIASLTGLFINISPPATCIDMVGSILSVPAIQYGEIADQAFAIEGLFVRDNKDIDTKLIFILEEESLELILQKLGVTYA